MIFKFSGFYKSVNSLKVRVWDGDQYRGAAFISDAIKLAEKEGKDFEFDSNDLLARLQMLKDQVDSLFPGVRPMPTDYCTEMRAIAAALEDYCAFSPSTVRSLTKGYLIYERN